MVLGCGRGGVGRFCDGGSRWWLEMLWYLVLVARDRGVWLVVCGGGYAWCRISILQEKGEWTRAYMDSGADRS